MWIHPKYFFILLGVSEFALAIFRRSRSKSASKDRGSFAALWIVIGLSIYVALWWAMSGRTVMANYEAVYPVGVVLFVAGMGLRWWAILHLGRWFTVNVAIAADHRVVDDGPYRLVRHPSYTGAIVYFIGAGLLLGNWLSLLLLAVPITVMFLWRMRIEERALSEALGTAYTDYMARTKRLVPFVY